MHIKNRYQAFVAHLGISVLVALLSALLVFVLWYPAPLAALSGVTSIFLLVLAVDVVVGPVITLIVFNRGKPELRRDLAVVLALQLAALAYGLHTVSVARPVYLVFAVDRFELVFANDLTSEKLARVTDERFRTLPVFGPQTVAARRPSDSKERNDIMFGALQGGDDVPQLPQFYEPLANQKQQLLQRMEPLGKLATFNRHDQATVDALFRRFPESSGRVGFLPVKGKVADGAAIISVSTGDVLEIVELKPWD